MGVIRAIGNVFLVLGAAALGAGVWLWLSGRDLAQAAGQLWYDLDKASLNLVQAVVQRYIHPVVWDSVFVPWLLLPAWRALAILVVGCGAIGVLLMLAASRRRRRTFRR
jgi:uncharacterized membrane protein YcfT